MGTRLMPPQLKQTGMAFIRAAACIIALSLSALPGHAQQNPFGELAGSWAGNGNITLNSGTRERINCRANYETPESGTSIRLALRCASDSYTFDFSANGVYRDGVITGQWDERTRHAAGTFTGSVKGNHIEGRAEGQTFSALLGLTTTGNRQSISIRSPGSTLSDVAIVLSRK
jgi:hypothetical protein